MIEPRDTSDTNQASVLGEAVLKAGAKLGLSATDVGQIIGRDRTSIVRNGVDPETKNGQLALILVRIYRGLYALVGGGEDEMRHWMHSPIRTLQGVPAELARDVSGLVRIAEYIDAMRGKV